MKKFYIVMEVLGLLATGLLGGSIWYYTHSLRLCMIALVCLFFVELGCFAHRDRKHEFPKG